MNSGYAHQPGDLKSISVSWKESHLQGACDDDDMMVRGALAAASITNPALSTGRHFVGTNSVHSHSGPDAVVLFASLLRGWWTSDRERCAVMSFLSILKHAKKTQQYVFSMRTSTCEPKFMEAILITCGWCLFGGGSRRVRWPVRR